MFDFKKMLKKARKVGLTTAATVGSLTNVDYAGQLMGGNTDALVDAAAKAANSAVAEQVATLDIQSGFWAGLLSAVLTCAVNYGAVQLKNRKN